MAKIILKLMISLTLFFIVAYGLISLDNHFLIETTHPIILGTLAGIMVGLWLTATLLLLSIFKSDIIQFYSNKIISSVILGIFTAFGLFCIINFLSPPLPFYTHCGNTHNPIECLVLTIFFLGVRYIGGKLVNRRARQTKISQEERFASVSD